MGKMDVIRSRILDGSRLDNVLSGWRKGNKKKVFTNGCFDILHLGHVDYLARASEMGDVLVVGLNSDKSVSSIKGQGRPVQDQHSRAVVLASLSFVSAVILFDEDTPLELIKRVQPDVLVKGSDYSPGEIVGGDLVLARGGKVETIEFVKGYSTTSILEKLSRL